MKFALANRVEPLITTTSELTVFAPAYLSQAQDFSLRLAQSAGSLRPAIADKGKPDYRRIQQASTVLAIYQEMTALTEILDAVIKARRERNDGTPTLIIALNTAQLADFGDWLNARAIAETLEGVRLILANSVDEVLKQLSSRLGPVLETNIIKMPESTEVANTKYKYFYCMSPELRALLTRLRGMAENGIERVYLLGAPGAGKTSLAYYYSLCRAQGFFVTVNLAAESTGDKAAMKSLLCGHVTGAFPGAAAREGAFSFAKDGVCFLDEGHGVTGVLMEVLMEALDSNQYMPYGATAKRPLDCAIIFASNRSWEYLRSIINIDQHARLGAMLLSLANLSKRQEDLIAVMSATMAKYRKKCVSWSSAQGISEEAWDLLKACPWHGNVRALMRVLETASVGYSDRPSADGLLQGEHIQEGISLWEPEEHESYKIYTSA